MLLIVGNWIAICRHEVTLGAAAYDGCANIFALGFTLVQKNKTGNKMNLRLSNYSETQILLDRFHSSCGSLRVIE